MNNMTEKPLAATPIKAARTSWLSAGWLPLIERYSLIWLSLLLLWYCHCCWAIFGSAWRANT